MNELVTDQQQTFNQNHQDLEGTGAAGGLQKIPSDRLILGGAGAALLGLAGVFGWRELHVDPAYLMSVAAGAGLVTSALTRQRRLSQIGLGVSAACGALGGMWYAAARTGALLPGLGLSLASGLLFLALGYRRARSEQDSRTIALGFTTLVVTVLAATWSLYFRFLTSGIASETPGRRMVLTLCWVGAGAALVVTSGRLREAAMRYAGYVFVAAATLKTLLYDTTHLGGGLRVLALLASGAVLLAGALLSQKSQKTETPAQ